MTKVLLVQLYALRAQLDAAIVLVEAETAPPPTAGCPHPRERQVNDQTFGEPPHVICLDCGERRLGTADV